jgi:hypothetical protein
MTCFPLHIVIKYSSVQDLLPIRCFFAGCCNKKTSSRLTCGFGADLFAGMRLIIVCTATWASVIAPLLPIFLKNTEINNTVWGK